MPSNCKLVVCHSALHAIWRHVRRDVVKALGPSNTDIAVMLKPSRNYASSTPPAAFPQCKTLE